jgi:hypothetical protein
VKLERISHLSSTKRSNASKKKKKRNHSGNTSVDSMMEDTPANYNLQNQRFNAEMEDDEEEVDEDDEDEYGS